MAYLPDRLHGLLPVGLEVVKVLEADREADWAGRERQSTRVSSAGRREAASQRRPTETGVLGWVRDDAVLNEALDAAKRRRVLRARENGGQLQRFTRVAKTTHDEAPELVG